MSEERLSEERLQEVERAFYLQSGAVSELDGRLRVVECCLRTVLATIASDSPLGEGLRRDLQNTYAAMMKMTDNAPMVDGFDAGREALLSALGKNAAPRDPDATAC